MVRTDLQYDEQRLLIAQLNELINKVYAWHRKGPRKVQANRELRFEILKLLRIARDNPFSRQTYAPAGGGRLQAGNILTKVEEYFVNHLDPPIGTSGQRLSKRPRSSIPQIFTWLTQLKLIAEHLKRALDGTFELPQPGQEMVLLTGAVYVADDDEVLGEALVQALMDLAVECGIGYSFAGEAEIGSWFQRIWLKISAAASNEEVVRRFEILEKAAEVALLGERSANMARANSEAVLNLMAAAEKTDNFAAVLDRLLLVKHTDVSGKVHVKTKLLSVAEQKILERENWKSLRDPESILMNLESMGPSMEIESGGSS